MDDYVTKPISSRDIDRVLLSIVTTRRLTRPVALPAA